MLERYFQLSAHGTTVKTELLAGRVKELPPMVAVIALVFVLKFALL